MTKRVKYASLQKIILALLCIVLLSASGRYVSSAFADNALQYTNVLTDLQSDKNFNPAQYPDKAKDHSIQVIQIAESANKELFVYTYQPSQKTTYIVAAELNMSLTDSAENTAPYGLTLLNSNGVFCKYRVDGVTVSDEALRYYNIVSISRAWDKTCDGDPKDENGNTRETVVYKVARRCVAQTEGDRVIYTYDGLDVITITAKYVGQLYKTEKRVASYHVTEDYYVAFATDRKIDTLLSAKVGYDVVTIANAEGDIIKRSPWTTVECCSDKVEHGSYSSWWFNKKFDYSWETISTVNEFVKAENIAKPEKLEGTEWVIRFYHNEYTIQKLGLPYPTDAPGDVAILELSFYTDGQFYDLGVVDNKQTGSGVPDNTNPLTAWDKFLAWVKNIMTKIFGWTNIPDWAAVLFIVGALFVLGLGIAVVALFVKIIAPFMPVIAQGIKSFFIGLFYVLSLPVRGIIALVRRKRGDE